MKTHCHRQSASENHRPSAIPLASKRGWSIRVIVPILAAAWLGLAPAACGQPGLVWTTDLGARLFAVDAQTNVYANAGGTVILLNGAGVPLQTNVICPRSGFAQRDAAGNFYFAGIMPYTTSNYVIAQVLPQDFGGVVLSNRLIYIAKYTAAGTLLWASEFGPTGSDLIETVHCDDLQLDQNGNAYVGYSWRSQAQLTNVMQRIDSSGSVSWGTWGVVFPVVWAANPGFVRFGDISPTNGYVLRFGYGPNSAQNQLFRFETNGTTSELDSWYSRNQQGGTDVTRPVCDSAGTIYYVEVSFEQGKGTFFWLKKRSASGSLIWRHGMSVSDNWTAGPDSWDGVHLANNNSQLWRFDSAGELAWIQKLPSPCNAFILDASGNRFISMSSGALARLGTEPLLRAHGRSLIPQGFNIRITGDPGLAYEMFASSNLTTWDSLGTVTNLTGETDFFDPAATNFPIRFYKAPLWP